jgi:hypothetical protein
VIRSALREYAADVRERRFPEEQHEYAMPPEELELFERGTRTESESESWL